MQNIKMKMTAVAMGVVLAASFAFANQDKDTRLNVNLKDADLVTATKMVTERTGLQFIFKSTKSFGKVTLQLKDQSADDVIRYICDAAGAYVTRDENGVYVITADKPIIDVPTISNAKPASKIMRKIKLLHAGADEVFARVVMNKILDPMAKHVEMYRAINMAKMMVSGSTDNTAVSTRNVLDSVSNYNTYQPTATPISQKVGTESGSSIALPGDSANQRGGGGNAGFGGGQQGGGGNGLGGGGQGQGQGGNTTLQPGQGLVITTTQNLDQSLGYNVNYTRGTVVAGMSGSDFLRASDPVFLTYASGDAVMRLRTKLSEGYGRVVTAPIIRTINNTPATVSAFTQDWILTTTTVATNGGFLTTVNPQQLTLGTTLSVTPRINADNTITMGLAPQVSTPVGTRTFNPSSGSSIELPINTTQGVQCVVNVKDRETIVLGGLNSESTNTTTNRVPVLSDLPILGQFFRGVTKGRTSSELLIFVTPVILDDEDKSINP